MGCAHPPPPYKYLAGSQQSLESFPGIDVLRNLSESSHAAPIRATETGTAMVWGCRSGTLSMCNCRNEYSNPDTNHPSDLDSNPSGLKIMEKVGDPRRWRGISYLWTHTYTLAFFCYIPKNLCVVLESLHKTDVLWLIVTCQASLFWFHL